jgi:hypothetical protein
LNPKDEDQTEAVQVVDQARNWWKKNKGAFIASAEMTLGIVDESLNGMPIYGPQAAVRAAAATLKALQVRYFLIESITTSHSF